MRRSRSSSSGAAAIRRAFASVVASPPRTRQTSSPIASCTYHESSAPRGDASTAHGLGLVIADHSLSVLGTGSVSTGYRYVHVQLGAAGAAALAGALLPRRIAYRLHIVELCRALDPHGRQDPLEQKPQRFGVHRRRTEGHAVQCLSLIHISEPTRLL